MSNLLIWLQLSGGTFPTGGFNHSYGLETYVKFDEVKTEKELKKLLKVFLSVMQYSDAIFLKEAFQAMENQDDKRLLELDQVYTALKVETELYNASVKTGRALLAGIFPLCPVEEQGQIKRMKDLEISHYPIIYGAISSILKLPLEEAVITYLYSSLSNIVQVATRIIPLGQTQSQILLVAIREEIMSHSLTYDYNNLTLENVTVFNPGLQLASLKHETLFARLCMS